MTVSLLRKRGLNLNLMDKQTRVRDMLYKRLTQGPEVLKCSLCGRSTVQSEEVGPLMLHYSDCILRVRG